jgi:hypothetical protein
VCLLDLHERPMTHWLAVDMEKALDIIRLVVSDPLTRFTPFASLADCRVADGTGEFWSGSRVAGNCLQTTSPLGLGSLADAIRWVGVPTTPHSSHTPPAQRGCHLRTSQHAFCVQYQNAPISVSGMFGKMWYGVLHSPHRILSQTTHPRIYACH